MLSTRWSPRFVGSVIAVAVVAAFSAGTAGAATGSFWTQDQINKKIYPNYLNGMVAKVPKGNQNVTFGFINWAISYPFFKEWSNGMKAATKLFGIKFLELDSNWNTGGQTALFDQLIAQGADVIGAMPGNQVMVSKANAAGVKFIVIDTIIPGSAFIGIPDKKAGELAGNHLGKALKEKLAGPWKGRKILYLGFGGAGCSQCTTRVQSALATIRTYHPATRGQYPTMGDIEGVQRFVTDILTSHPSPKWGFVMTSFGDEPLVGAANALKAAKRLKDGLIVTQGGDSTGRKLVRDFPGTVIGSVDFNPFSEGFNWVIAGLAYLKGKHFSQYPVTSILTLANVNKLYPNDPK